MKFANVIINISHEAVDKPFQYILPKEMESAINVGSLVNVPFGPGNNLKKAYVIGFSDTPQIAIEKLKYIDSIDDKDIPIEGKLMSLAFWMAKTYGATFASCLRTVLPVTRKAKIPEKRTIESSLSREELISYRDEYITRKRFSVAKERLLNALIKEGELPWEAVTKKLNIPSATIRDMEKTGVLRVISKKSHVRVNNALNIEKKEVTPNPYQAKAIDTFVSDWRSGKRGTYLVHGITGSGKTEVYIRMLEAVINDGKDAIVLIPEIALTYQTLMRFYHKFGDMVSFIHSRLSPGERYDIYERAKSGEIRIIVGPRSALFTPFKDLGIIIMDEEHETSYKSEKVPRYHAREVALERAKLSRASVVLGSATPSMESYYRAAKGDFKLITLSARATGAELPTPEIVDMRSELRAGNKSIISVRLRNLIKENLDNKKQTMLFLNRRGMLSVVSCRACGEVIKCPHCDVSMTLHRDGKLHCHYCGYERDNPKTCPSCGSQYIGGFKAGTEKIEGEIKQIFPSARVLRMDADSTRTKDGHEKILSVFANRGADILIGTQMIVKGHDFPDVTLVGILCADLSLNANDFRSAERTFDLITQACGRAGRDGIGKAVIQAYRPDHYAITLSAAQDYISFYNKEIAFRNLMGYPPTGHMLLVMLLSHNENKLTSYGEDIVKRLSKDCGNAWVSNLVTPGISKIQDVHRRIIYLKSTLIEELIEIREKIEGFDKEPEVSVYYDMDPLNMF